MAFKAFLWVLWVIMALVLIFGVGLALASHAALQEEPSGWVFQNHGEVWMSTIGPQDLGIIPERLHLHPPAWNMELCLSIGVGPQVERRCLKMHQWFALGKVMVGNERAQ